MIWPHASRTDEHAGLRARLACVADAAWELRTNHQFRRPHLEIARPGVVRAVARASTAETAAATVMAHCLTDLRRLLAGLDLRDAELMRLYGEVAALRAENARLRDGSAGPWA